MASRPDDAAYTCFLAGNVLLWPAIVSLATKIGQTKPALAFVSTLG